MKIRAVAAALVAVVGCNASGGFEKVSESSVDVDQKAVAQRLAERIYQGCVSGSHQPLGEQEAIPEMREALTPAKLAATCVSIKGQFGEYRSLDYAETWKPSSGSLRVYRFKGHFGASSDTPEIRVVMDGAKLSGFWLKPWADPLR